MIELTDEQRQQLDSGKAIDLCDLQSTQRYVILRKDIYDRVCHLLFDDADWTDDELRLHLARSAKENGWASSGLNAYDRHAEELDRRCR